MHSPAAWRLCAVINSLVYFKVWTLDMNKHLECAHDRLQPGANFLPVSMMHERVGSKNKIIPGVCNNCPSHVCLATCSGAQTARSGREGGTEGGREQRAGSVGATVLTNCSALDKDRTSGADVYIILMCFCSIKNELFHFFIAVLQH